MKIVLVTALILLAYAYLAYPLAIWLWSKVRSRRVRRAGITLRVSFLLPAHNEARYIHGKIKNTLAQDYPRDMVEVIVVSDGSTDGTYEVAATVKKDNVKVLCLTSRGGKPSAINAGLRQCTGEIVVFSDASSMLEKSALRELVSAFADEDVGCVSGVLVPESGKVGLDIYRKTENLIRTSEARIHSAVGATGALFAARRGLLEELPPDTILDDLTIPLRIIRRGYRCVVEPAARCIEQEKVTHRQEFARKVRTLAGNYQAFARDAWALNPFASPIWLMALSHKVLRLFCPMLLVLLFISSAILSWQGAATAQWALVVQGFFYALALLGRIAPAQLRRGKTLIPYSFCVLNLAALVAPFAYFSGRAGVKWRKHEAVHAR